MARLQKTKKPKIWTPHRYLVAAIRKTWRWSPERREALKKAQVKPNHWACAKCAGIFTRAELTTKRGRKRMRMQGAVDHIVPIGKQPRKFSEYPAYLKKTFCGVENLQVLCTSCHQGKTNNE